MFRKTTDIIAEKEAQLTALVSQSANAVSLITSTVDQLETVNEQIAQRRQEIESARSELSKLDNSMEQQFDHNSKIINKFKAFLED